MGPRSQSKDSKDAKRCSKSKKLQKAPVRLVTHISLRVSAICKGKRRKPSCDYWHPPECVKHKTDECCKCCENCAFQTTMKRQARSREKDSNLHLYSVIQNWVVYIRTSWTYERETGHTEEERQKFFESASWIRTHEMDLNIIATPTRIRFWTEIRTTSCGQKMVQEKQLVDLPRLLSRRSGQWTQPRRP